MAKKIDTSLMSPVDIYKLVINKKLVKRFPKYYWDKPDSLSVAAEIMRYLIENILCWNDIEIKSNFNCLLLKENYLIGMLQKVFNQNPFAALENAYPGKYKPWELHRVSNQYWNKETACEAIKWIIEKYHVDITDITYNYLGSINMWGLSAYLLDNKDIDLYTIANTLYSPHKYKQWDFSKTSNKYWESKENRIYAIQWLANKLNMKELTHTDFKNEGLASLLNRYYSGSVKRAVREAFSNKSHKKSKKQVGRKALDLTGQKFGKLTVIKRVEGKDKRNSYWLCKCECDNEKTFAGSTLKSGDAVSCGCYNAQLKAERYKDISGQKFGRLTAIKRIEGSLWECKCDCGESCKILANNLGRKTISCGCNKIEKITEDCVENTRLRNLTAKKRNTKYKDSGCKGVTWSVDRNKWVSQIRLQGVNHYLGRYDDLNKAIEARKQAEEKYFKPVLDKYKKENINS